MAQAHPEYHQIRIILETGQFHPEIAEVMPKPSRKQSARPPQASGTVGGGGRKNKPREKTSAGLWVTLGCIAVAVAGFFSFKQSQRPAPNDGTTSRVTPAATPSSPASNTSSGATNVAVDASGGTTSDASAQLPTSAVKSALMVTVELDFDGPVPSIAEGLRYIERVHKPEDGQGRVFSILDAYGGATPDGKQLHMSMHLSMEKPGIGSLVFKRTGKTLWSSRIVPAPDGTRLSQPQGLTILFDNGEGKLLTVDGSTNPSTIMEAGVKEAGLPVMHLWPEEAVREMTFLYSGCGCPVKVMAQRKGGRILRTSDTPVLFPDDPDALQVIHHLMGW